MFEQKVIKIYIIIILNINNKIRFIRLVTMVQNMDLVPSAL
jgi:hypothetical protein